MCLKPKAFTTRSCSYVAARKTFCDLTFSEHSFRSLGHFDSIMWAFSNTLSSVRLQPEFELLFINTFNPEWMRWGQARLDGKRRNHSVNLSYQHFMTQAHTPEWNSTRAQFIKVNLWDIWNSYGKWSMTYLDSSRFDGKNKVALCPDLQKCALIAGRVLWPTLILQFGMRSHIFLLSKCLCRPHSFPVK